MERNFKMVPRADKVFKKRDLEWTKKFENGKIEPKRSQNPFRQSL